KPTTATSPPTRPPRPREGARHMSTHTHQTAPTQFVEAGGIRFAYRRFGKTGGVPLVFNQHYTGTMDYWDPAVTDGLAAYREVILFNNAGVSSSSGEVPESIDEMGFSIGGMVTQEIAVQAPDLVRRLILVGTGMRGGVGIAPMTDAAAAIFGATYDPPENLWLAVHFAPSATSQAAGRAFLKRKHLRQVGRDPEVSPQVAPAQIAALGKYGE